MNIRFGDDTVILASTAEETKSHSQCLYRAALWSRAADRKKEKMTDDISTLMEVRRSIHITIKETDEKWMKELYGRIEELDN